MTNLSPAAQAVLDAFDKGWTYYDDIGPANIAAALRAAADQVVPLTHAEPYFDDFERGEWVARTDARYELLAIADELEATT
jgi:hypothetical protein